MPPQELTPEQSVQWESLTKLFAESEITMQDIHDYYKMQVLNSIEQITNPNEKAQYIEFYKELVRINNEKINRNNWTDRAIDISNREVIDCLKFCITILEADRDSFKRFICSFFANQDPFSMYPLLDILQNYYENNNSLPRLDFINFLMENNITDLTVIQDLSAVRAVGDLQTTYEGSLLRLKQEDEYRRKIQQATAEVNVEVLEHLHQVERYFFGTDNQTVHNKETEERLQNDVRKLHERYDSKPTSLYNLDTLIGFLGRKMNELVDAGKLQNFHKKFIEASFANIFSLEENSQSRIFELLKLAVCSLEDKDAATKMLKCVPTLEDMQDRWSGWFKSAIYDSQRAYVLDGSKVAPIPPERLASLTGAELANQNLPHETLIALTEQQLTELVAAETAGKSCFGGTLNRIIDGLSGIHPDVVRNLGEDAGAGEIANANLYTIHQFGRTKFKEVAREYLKNVVDLSSGKLKRMIKELQKLEDDSSLTKSTELTIFETALTEHIITTAAEDLHKGQMTVPVKVVLEDIYILKHI